MMTDTRYRFILIALTAIAAGCANAPETESDNSAVQSSLTGSDPNWLLVHNPFTAIVAGTDVDGWPLAPCRANLGGGVHLGKTRPDWSACGIGYAGQEMMVQPYETLVSGWTATVGGAVPGNAYSFGTDGSGGPNLYPCRAYLDGGRGLQLGKVRPGLSGCFVPYGGQEVSVVQYEVLTNAIPLQVVSNNGAHPAPYGVVGGQDSDGGTLYVCQAWFGGGFVPGKTRADLTSCIVAWGGSEHYVSNYNMLVPGFKASGQVYPAGNESDGTVLGVCKANYQNSLQVGKRVGTGACNFGFGGAEVSLPSGSLVLAF